MPAMNGGMQRRIGKLPKTSELAQPQGSGYYGGSHAGFGRRQPTPLSNGMFGIGSIYGDGKLHYYGDNEGQANLPAHGIYGTSLGNTAVEAQISDIAIPGSGSPSYYAATESHLFGDKSSLFGGVTTAQAVGVAALVAAICVMYRK